MEDLKIIELYFARSEEAIRQTQKKYGRYCFAIANNILCDESDSQECVNDTYLMVWDTIPPKKPERFSVYIGKLTRNLSISKLRKNNALKRSTKSDVVWDEIEDLIPDPVADLADTVILKEAINRFLRELSKKDRMIFVKRYWYMSPSKDIAKDLGVSDSYVRLKLFRLRNDFKEFLSREGIEV